MSPPSAQALDPRWLGLIDRLAPRLLRHDDRVGDALARSVRRASELYTRERESLEQVSVAARLRFFLLRDLPKIQGPLAALVAAGALPADRWRVLDVGAGLGTTSLGVTELARRAGVTSVDLMALERDAKTRDLLPAIVAGALEDDLIAPVELRVESMNLEARAVGPAIHRASHAGEGFDLVVVGLVLNELFSGLTPEEATARRAGLLEALVATLRPGGALIVLEPALRAVTRDLMAIRDALIEGRRPIRVEAPCPHARPCPMLPNVKDWCHAELPFALPEPLAEVARASGLRFERLTYAYLTLRAGEGAPSFAEPTYRVVGGPVASKGKSEWTLCGAAGEGGPGLVRLRRMDRERGAENAALDEARRDALLSVDGISGEAFRARAGVPIRSIAPAAAHGGTLE